jgi:hypothetical protein
MANNQLPHVRKQVVPAAPAKPVKETKPKAKKK